MRTRSFGKICLISAAFMSPLGCSDSQQGANELTSVNIDSKSIFSSVVGMEPMQKAAVFRRISRLSFEDYYEFVAAGLNNGPVLVDKKLVSGLKSTWALGHADITALQHKYTTLGALWREIGIDPVHMSQKDLEAAINPSQLALGDPYQPVNSYYCANATEFMNHRYGVEANAIAAAYSALPVDGASKEVPVATTDYYLGIKGTQADRKYRYTSLSRAPAYFVGDYTIKVGQRIGNTKYFNECLEKTPPPPPPVVYVSQPGEAADDHPAYVGIPQNPGQISKLRGAATN